MPIVGLVVLGVLAAIAAGCGPSLKGIRSSYEKRNPKPNWIDNPPTDHYVGVSGCDSKIPEHAKNWGKISYRDWAYRDALQKKCGGSRVEPKGDLKETWLLNPAQEYMYPCEKGGMMMYGLFGSSDLDCGRIER